MSPAGTVAPAAGCVIVMTARGLTVGDGDAAGGAHAEAISVRARAIAEMRMYTRGESSAGWNRQTEVPSPCWLVIGPSSLERRRSPRGSRLPAGKAKRGGWTWPNGG